MYNIRIAKAMKEARRFLLDKYNHKLKAEAEIESIKEAFSKGNVSLNEMTEKVETLKSEIDETRKPDSRVAEIFSKLDGEIDKVFREQMQTRDASLNDLKNYKLTQSEYDVLVAGTSNIFDLKLLDGYADANGLRKKSVPTSLESIKDRVEGIALQFQRANTDPYIERLLTGEDSFNRLLLKVFGTDPETEGDNLESANADQVLANEIRLTVAEADRNTSVLSILNQVDKITDATLQAQVKAEVLEVLS